MEATTSSFAFLKVYGPLYFRLAERAEQLLAIEPAMTLVALRQLAEALAQHAATAARIDARGEHQIDLLRELGAASCATTSRRFFTRFGESATAP